MRALVTLLIVECHFGCAKPLWTMFLLCLNLSGILPIVAQIKVVIYY